MDRIIITSLRVLRMRKCPSIVKRDASIVNCKTRRNPLLEMKKLPTAFRMFMIRSKIEKGLPFDAKLPENAITRSEALSTFNELRRQAANLPEMSLNEINSEIDAVRAERRARI